MPFCGWLLAFNRYWHCATCSARRLLRFPVAFVAIVIWPLRGGRTDVPRFPSAQYCPAHPLPCRGATTGSMSSPHWSQTLAHGNAAQPHHTAQITAAQRLHHAPGPLSVGWRPRTGLLRDVDDESFNRVSCWIAPARRADRMAFETPRLRCARRSKWSRTTKKNRSSLMTRRLRG